MNPQNPYRKFNTQKKKIEELERQKRDIENGKLIIKGMKPK